MNPVDGGAESGALPAGSGANDAALAEIAEAWPRLTRSLQDAVLTVVRAASLLTTRHLGQTADRTGIHVPNKSAVTPSEILFWPSV